MVFPIYGMTRIENEIEALLDSFALENAVGASPSSVTAVMEYFTKAGIDFVYDEYEYNDMSGAVVSFAWIEDSKPHLVSYDVSYERGTN